MNINAVTFTDFAQCYFLPRETMLL